MNKYRPFGIIASKGLFMRLIKDRNILNRLKPTDEPVFVLDNGDNDRGVSYLTLMGKLGRRFRNTSKEDLLKKLFPRTAADMVAIDAKTGKVAMDAAIKPAMYNSDLPEEMVPFFSYSFIGFQACALLLQNPYINKVCSIPARDAVAVDYKLHYAHEDGDGDNSTDQEEEQEKLNALKEKSDKQMKIKDVCRDANYFKKGYGQIILVPHFSIDMTKAMAEPFDPKAIKKGTYRGMHIVQPFWVTYQLSGDGVSRPDKAGYYEPEYYIINGSVKVHKSWIIKLINGPVSDILKPVYYYGGIPLTQQIYERVFCAEKTANEAPKLALTKRLLIVDGNINNLAANPDEAYATMENVLALRDNMGVMVKNPSDQVSQIDTSLTDFDALIMTQFQLVAAIAEMPATKLMKTQLKGLANTGEYETKDYNQTLVEIQEGDFDTILAFHYKLLCLSEHGKDLELVTVWNPIDAPTEAELADIEAKQASTDMQYIQAGVIDASEVRDALRNNEDSRYHNLSDEMPEPPEMMAGGDNEGDDEEEDRKGEDALDFLIAEDDDDIDDEYQYAYAVEV